MGDAVNRLEDVVALATGRIYVPPHTTTKAGRPVKVEGYWRKRRPGEKGNVASLPAGSKRTQPRGKNAGGKRQPGGGIDAKDLKKSSSYEDARDMAVGDLEEMMFEDGPPTRDESDAALRQRMDREPTSDEKRDFNRDVSSAYGKWARDNRTPSPRKSRMSDEERARLDAKIKGMDQEDRAGGGKGYDAIGADKPDTPKPATPVAVTKTVSKLKLGDVLPDGSVVTAKPYPDRDLEGARFWRVVVKTPEGKTVRLEYAKAGDKVEVREGTTNLSAEHGPSVLSLTNKLARN